MSDDTEYTKDHGNIARRHEKIGGGDKAVTRDARTEYITSPHMAAFALDRQSSPPPGLVRDSAGKEIIEKLDSKDFRPRPGTPGTPEWEALREAERQEAREREREEKQPC